MCMRLMLQAAMEAVRPQNSVALRRLLPEYDADSSEDSSRRCLLQLIMINRYRNDTRLLQECLIDVEIVVCLGQLSAGDDDSRYMQIQQQFMLNRKPVWKWRWKTRRCQRLECILQQIQNIQKQRFNYI